MPCMCECSELVEHFQYSIEMESDRKSLCFADKIRIDLFLQIKFNPYNFDSLVI